jgi:hypothetical protein
MQGITGFRPGVYPEITIEQKGSGVRGGFFKTIGNMNRLKRAIALLTLCTVAACVTHAAQTSPATPAKPAASATSATTVELPPSPQALLPNAFAGWAAAAPIQALTDPAQADATNADALKEYGFTFGALGCYKREGETLTLRALEFDDESGAYGAYTFYRPTGWPREQIGTGAASDKNRVIFWRGNTVVDATFSRVGPMSVGEMREIAARLPLPAGNKALPPPILSFLPQQSLSGQTTHYAEGPSGYAGAGGVLPAGVAGFDRGAEAITANYALPSGPATLSIFEYPTPQIARLEEDTIRNYIKAGSKAQPPWPQPLMDSDLASLEVRRSGVLVALVSGDAVPDESHELLERVHYEADLTSIPQPVESEIIKTGKLLFGIVALVSVGAIAAILLGFFLGGGRALYRVARGKPPSSVYDEEFIHLDLRDDGLDLREDANVERAAAPGPHPKG